MGKIIWIFGPSAVGKKTLIKKICYNNIYNGDVKNRANIKPFDCNIPIIIPNSLYFKRLEILDNVFNNNLYFNYIIHGQYVDIYNDILDTLKNKYSDKFNSCFYLYIDEKKIEKRRKKRNKERELENMEQLSLDKNEVYKNKDRDIINLNKIFDNVFIINE